MIGITDTGTLGGGGTTIIEPGPVPPLPTPGPGPGPIIPDIYFPIIPAMAASLSIPSGGGYFGKKRKKYGRSRSVENPMRNLWGEWRMNKDIQIMSGGFDETVNKALYGNLGKMSELSGSRMPTGVGMMGIPSMSMPSMSMPRMSKSKSDRYGGFNMLSGKI